MSGDALPLSAELAELLEDHGLVVSWTDWTPPVFECSCGVAFSSSVEYGPHLVEMAR